MDDDLRLAFATPEDRARATPPACTPPDRISLRDHVIATEIGAFQPERGVAQRLRFNVVVEVAPAGAIDDDVDRILSYDRITEAIADALADTRLNLLETLAESVADSVLAAPQALRTFVRIEKLDRGPGALGVEIVRTRSAAHARPVDAAPRPAPAPQIVLLDSTAIDGADLPGWLDALCAAPGPVVLVTGLPDPAPAPTGQAAADRHIALLAMEQNAWRLAARDSRCAVATTRTELDWALRNAGIAAWAPSRMILDATDPPAADPGALAVWLGHALGARMIRVIGQAALPGTGIPVMRGSDRIDTA